MAIELHPPLRPRPAKAAQRDNRLSFLDQAAFRSLRATGRNQIMQGVWIYRHPIDIDGVRRFHRDFGYRLYGRLVERSPLPFGRDRWVSASSRRPELDIAERRRSCADLSDWVDERARLPVDPECGPGWHLAVQPFTDGSTTVCLTGSHCLGDGVGAILEIVAAVAGDRSDLGYPPPRSRPPLRAVVADTFQTAAAAPEIARTLAAAARLVNRRRDDIARSRPAPRPAIGEADSDHSVTVPATTVFVDARAWDECADSLGGTTYSLLAGFAARLADRIGRRRDDGAVTLLVAVSDRVLDGADTRALAMPIGTARVDPTPVTTDLSDVRAAVRQTIKTLRAAPDESLQILPLIPFIPKRVMKRMADVFVGAADAPVSCSNLGDLPAEVGRVDGTDAEYFYMRGIDQHITRRQLERDHGQLVVVSGRIAGKVCIDVVAYQLDAENSKPRLRGLVMQTLAEFNLTGAIF